MSKYEVRGYRYVNGSCPTEVFLDELPEKVQGKAFRWLEMLAEAGPDLHRPYADIICGKIREIRISYARSEYRMLYFFDNKSAIITHGFIKKTDRVPLSEIAKAESVMNDYLIRKKLGAFKV